MVYSLGHGRLFVVFNISVIWAPEQSPKCKEIVIIIVFSTGKAQGLDSAPPALATLLKCLDPGSPLGSAPLKDVSDLQGQVNLCSLHLCRLDREPRCLAESDSWIGQSSGINLGKAGKRDKAVKTRSQSFSLRNSLTAIVLAAAGNK